MKIASFKKGLKDLWLSIKTSLKNSNEWLFWFCAFFTLVLIVMIYIEFFLTDYETPLVLVIGYIGFITTYTTNKEINKWTASGLIIEKPGELFVYIWGLTLVVMGIIQFLTKNQYQVPEELINICGGVLAVFVGNQVSKSFRTRKRIQKGKKSD